MRLTPYMLLLLLLGGQAVLRAQQTPSDFYARMGKSDGLYEQSLNFDQESDELDYWRDQRFFERKLYQENPVAYRGYLQAKREVYLAHRPLCGSSCQHGDYYWLQSAYYAQFGPDTLPEYSVNGASHGVRH